jgi:hypothetical protein
MTIELKAVFAKLEQLPEQEQMLYASVLEEMLVADKKWMHLFEKSADLLADMAHDAIAEYERGETRPLEDVLKKEL